MSNYLISHSRIQQFQDETQKDETLRMIIKFIKMMIDQVNHRICRPMYVYILLIVTTCITLID